MQNIQINTIVAFMILLTISISANVSQIINNLFSPVHSIIHFPLLNTQPYAIISPLALIISNCRGLIIYIGWKYYSGRMKLNGFVCFIFSISVSYLLIIIIFCRSSNPVASEKLRFLKRSIRNLMQKYPQLELSSS